MKIKIYIIIFLLFIFNAENSKADFYGPPPVMQSGTVTAGHLASWKSNLTIQDSGGSLPSSSNPVPIASGGTGGTTVNSAALNLQSCYVLARSGSAVSVTGTLSETTLATIAIPGNALGANGIIRVTTQWSFTNSATSKTNKQYFGGTGGFRFVSRAFTTTAQDDTMALIWNRNAANSQVAGNGILGNSTSASGTGSIDTTVTQNIVFTGTLALITDTTTLESYMIEICPGN